MDSVRNIVIFIGPPGSGKGSLSHLCNEQLNWVQLSTGNLCRKHIAQRSDIGLKMDEAIRAGKLIDDHLIISMVDEWLIEQGNQQTSVILDGYPRTVVQAESLMRLLKEKLPEFNVSVVKFLISDDQVVYRLGGRSICQNKNCQAVYSTLPGSALRPSIEMVCDKCSCILVRRPDDEFTAIKERLNTYYKHEQELLNFYNAVGVAVKKVEVEKPLHEVFDEFKVLMGI